MEEKDLGIVEEVAKFVEGTKYEDFSPAITSLAKRCITDGVGVILAGTEEPCVQIARDWVLSLEGKRESTLLGKGKTKVAAPFAALVNGTAGHALDWDDTALSKSPDRALLVHPTMPPLAAGMAIAEPLRLSGRDFLTAFLVGFEIECKIAAAIHPDHWVRGFHSSKTCGIFGAAVTTSKLMNLSSPQIKNAVGIAASMASGIMLNFGTMAKPLHVGQAGEGGVIAAQLASRGFEAHPEALGGNKGFFHAFAGGFDPEEICGKLGKPFSIIEPGVSIKPYPCGVVGHPAMDAMLSLVVKNAIQPDDVDHVKVSTGSNVLAPKGPFLYKKAQTGLQGKFCVSFQMASMILRRKAGPSEFTDEFAQSPAVQEMMDRVEAIVDPEIDALGEDRIFSLIEVHLKNGRVVKGKTSEHYRGGPQNPLGRIELEEKFNDATQMVLTPGQAKKIFATIESLEKLDSIGTLIEMAAG